MKCMRRRVTSSLALHLLFQAPQVRCQLFAAVLKEPEVFLSDGKSSWLYTKLC